MTILVALIVGLMQIGALVAMGSIVVVYFSRTKDPKWDKLVYWAGGSVIVIVELFTAVIMGWI